MYKEIKKSFDIGDEWLYYKIYTGYKTSDLILIELIKPLVESLKLKKIISKWFFIRYADPEYHLRLRFNFKKKENISIIIDELNCCFKEFSNNGLIWRVQIESYERELARYGENSIDFAENFFFNDSEMTLQLIQIIDKNSSEELRWLIALKTIDNYFNDFNFKLDQKLQFVKNMKMGYYNYYNTSSKSLSGQLNYKYKKNGEIIKLFIEENSYYNFPQSEVLKTIQKNSFKNRKVITNLLTLNNQSELKIGIDDLLSSYLHMHLNRLFKTRNTLNEYVCYDFLYRYYMSVTNKKRVLK